jgi:hypothetical protein
MHKLESFATSCGSKINKPHIDNAFYPVVDEKFICVSKESPYDAKSYDLLDDVIFHIKPYLDKNNISIIEIGKDESNSLFYTKNLKNLKFKQNSYLLSKCILYFGNTNIYAHLASAAGKNIVCASNYDYIDISKPYWMNDESLIALPDSDHKPLFSEKENPKTINKVKPEVLACKILDLLGIKHDLNLIETIYIGPDYPNQSLDVISSNMNGKNLDQNLKPNIRLDKKFAPEFLPTFSNFNNITITTDRPIPLEFIQPIKKNVSSFIFIVDSNTNPEEVSDLSKFGKPINLFTRDKDSLPSIRLRFFDYIVMPLNEYSISSIDIDSIEGLKFLSKKNIFSDTSMFNSYLSLDKKINISNVEDIPSFWDDLNHYRLYKINT